MKRPNVVLKCNSGTKTELVSMAESYMEDEELGREIDSHYAYELLMKVMYGEDVFDYINSLEDIKWSTLKTLTQEDIGRKVVYKNRCTLDEGIISSYNEKYIFVKYGTCATAQATSPEDLTFSF